MSMDQALKPFNLNGLPLDVVSTILDKSNVWDVEGLRCSLPNDSTCRYLTKECKRRVSAVAYFDEHFGNGKKLLQAMSKCKVYLSGSRSLEYFRNGSTDSDSDWDFYASTDESASCRFIQCLKSIGVEWYDTEARIRQCVQGLVDRVFVNEERRLQLIASGGLQRIKDEFDLRVISSADSHGPAMIKMINGRLTCVPAEDSVPYGHMMFDNIVHGRLTNKGKTSRVQLIVEHRGKCNLVKSPFLYHSSCVQSVITGHFACHFYGKLSSGNVNHEWDGNVRQEEGLEDEIRSNSQLVTERVDAARRKYANRGFMNMKSGIPSHTHHLRQAQDHLCYKVDFDPDEVCAPPVVDDWYSMKINGITWYETHDRTVLLPNATAYVKEPNSQELRDWFKPSEDSHGIQAIRTRYFGVADGYGFSDTEDSAGSDADD